MILIKWDVQNFSNSWIKLVILLTGSSKIRPWELFHPAQDICIGRMPILCAEWEWRHNSYCVCTQEGTQKHEHGFQTLCRKKGTCSRVSSLGTKQMLAVQVWNQLSTWAVCCFHCKLQLSSRSEVKIKNQNQQVFHPMLVFNLCEYEAWRFWGKKF